MKNKVNIINFIRGIEPREPMDLITPIKEHIKKLDEQGLKGTFLVQYDVLLNDEMVAILKACNKGRIEIGGWLEVVKPMVEQAGLQWNGRWDWDYHSDVGFLIGYQPEVRKKLVDIYMKKFYEVFSYYPKSMGSWLLDAVTLDYLQSYDIDAACICRDQYGTDGYSLWGGYYNQGYYPSVKNMLMPSQTAEKQINIPTFRMLGSDPIHQYDAGIKKVNGKYIVDFLQPVATLEPVYKDGGGNKEWVDWYFKENFSHDENVGFSYTQAGQENSFGWEAMKYGINYQYEKIALMQKNGEIECESLSETGRWFKQEYKQSPCCSMQFLSDINDNKQTIWFYSKKYRANLLFDDGILSLRDLHKFDENYAEKYLNNVETKHECLFDTLPIMDGYRFTNESTKAGVYFQNELGTSIKATSIRCEKLDESTLKAIIASDIGDITVLFEQDGLSVCCQNPIKLCFKFGKCGTDFYKVIGDTIKFKHNGFDYSIAFLAYEQSNSNNELTLLGTKKIELSFN